MIKIACYFRENLTAYSGGSYVSNRGDRNVTSQVERLGKLPFSALAFMAVKYVLEGAKIRIFAF